MNRFDIYEFLAHNWHYLMKKPQYCLTLSRPLHIYFIFCSTPTIPPHGIYAECFMQQLAKFTAVRHIIFFASLWFDVTQTHKQRHTAHSGANRVKSHISIYSHQQLCALSSYLCYTDWITHWNQIFLLSRISLLFKS